MIDPRTFRPLTLDAEGVRRLLPHRPPLLLVDGVEAISTEPPALRAFKRVTVDEPVFAGHFPGRAIWPGVYSIEGLAQTCGLLGALLAAPSSWAESSDAPEAAASPARQRENGIAPALTGAAVLAAADVKLKLPVFAGQRLDYLVVLTHTVDTVFRFDVEAAVGGQVAAKGTLTLAQVPR